MSPYSKPTVAKIPFTADAYQKLESELKRLTQELKEVKVRLNTAREMGDLSENGAYHYAKFELGSITRQIREIKHQLEIGEVVTKHAGAQQKVEFGCDVTLDNGKQTVTYMMVNEFESNPAQKKLAITSPIGKAIMGKKVGDQVEVEVPAGKLIYTIKKIA